MSAKWCISCLEKTGLVSVHEKLSFDGHSFTESSAAALVYQCFNIKMLEVRVLYAMCSACLTKLLQSYLLKEQILHNLDSIDNKTECTNGKNLCESKTECTSDFADSDEDNSDFDNLPLSTYLMSNKTKLECEEKKPDEVSKTKSNERRLNNKNVNWSNSLLIEKNQPSKLSSVGKLSNFVQVQENSCVNTECNSCEDVISMKELINKEKKKSHASKLNDSETNVSKSNISNGCHSNLKTFKGSNSKALISEMCNSKYLIYEESNSKFLRSNESNSKSLSFGQDNPKSLTSEQSNLKTLTLGQSNLKFLTSKKRNLKFLGSEQSNSNALLVGKHSKPFIDELQTEFNSLQRLFSDFYMFYWHNSKYRCVVCELLFGEVNDFKTHTRQHSIEDAEFFFHNTNYTRKRRVLKVDISTMKCRHCGEIMTKSETYRGHLSLKHNIESKDIFRLIMPYNLNKNEFVCGFCCKQFMYITNLNQHMNEHYRNFICSDCGKPFLSLHRLTSHMRNKHEKGIFKCKNHCDKTFESISKRDTDARTVKPTRWNLCPHCPEKLRSFYAKMVHLAVAHNEELKKYKCEACDKKFVTNAFLKMHIRKVHLQERSHICSDCGDAFFSKVTLRLHMVKHKGHKTFICDICDKAFARKNTLNTHKRIHNNDKRYVCQVCGRGFTQKVRMQSHLNVHVKPRSRQKVKNNNEV